MSMSFNKTFSVYEDGVVELVTIVSDIKEYIGDTYDQKEIIINLLDLLKEEIPSINNEHYPNTFSFKINAKEVEFRTDEGLRFGWIVILDNNIIGYQFHINFDNLSRNKRKVISKLIDCEWKEYTDDQLEKVEDEIHFSRRTTNEKEIIQTQEAFSTDEDIDVQSVHPQIQPDYSKANFLPTFVQDAPNIDENVVNEEQQQEEYDRQEYQPTKRPKLLGKSLLRSRQQTEIIQQYDENTEEQQEPPSIEEMAEAQDLMAADRQTVLQNGNIVEENHNMGYIEHEDVEVEYTENGFIKLDPADFYIRPGTTQTTVILRYEGEEFPINVLEQHAGIYRDVANKKLRIGRVVYDYQNYTVFGLPENYTPDQSVFIAHDQDPRHRQIIPDEAFVPQETIRKYEDIDIAAIQEEAIKREDYHTQMTGIKPRLKWNRNVKKNNNIDNNIQRPVLRQGRAFVMDDTPPETNTRFNNNNQSVRISNDGPSRWG